MSVTSITYPGRYSPAYGNIVYQVESTNQNTKYKFRYVFDVFIDSQKIARLKVTPQNPDWGQVDISRILQSYVDSHPINQGITNDVQPISKADWGWLDKDWLIYNVFIGEEYATTPNGDPIIYNGLGAQGDPVYDPAGDRYIANSIKEWNDGKSFDWSPFYLDTTNLPDQYNYNPDDHRFLTNAPRIQYVRESDWGTLAAFNFHFYPESIVSDPVYSAYFEFFDDGNELITTGRTYNLITNGGWRFNCSGNTADQPLYPDFSKKMISYVGTYPQNLFNNDNIGFPPLTKYYRVSLEKSVDTAIPLTPTPTLTPQPTPSVTSSPLPPPTAPVGVSATPTVTPTITPTPSATPPYDCVVGCARYCIYNYSRALTLNIQYTDCDTGVVTNIVVPINDSICVCACGTPVRTGGTTNYDIINSGICR
jgi:hypothetical protein